LKWVAKVETPLLQTKLYIPQPQTNHVPRPHLIQRMNEGAGRKLTLVVAPAGFSKTSLLGQWIAQTDRAVAWISLDDNDNEIARFLSYFILALQKIDEEVGVEPLAVLQASQSPEIDTLLAMLVNELSALEGSFSLILDDYHAITNPEIHESLHFLLDHSPPNLHLIIAGRADPFLPISRYRARGELVELRMEDLRFSSDEAAQYLNQVQHLGLSEGDVLALDSRTEGWISGIHLAALSLQGHKAPSQFIAELTGDDRYIIDYLVDEVLSQRPSGTQDFLLKTSILERMNPGLCDAITGETDGKQLLNALEQANLFILPLDNRRYWYRYHRLFADMLRQRLEENYSKSEISTLHQRASNWHEENSLVFEAIGHSISAEDFESAIRIIDQNAGMIFATSQLTSLAKLWGHFPQEVVLHHPKICLLFSWAWLATGHPDKAENCVRVVDESFGAEEGDLGVKELPVDVQSALVEVAVIRSQIAITRGDIASARELSELTLPLLEEDEGPYLYNAPPDSRTVAYFNLGMAHALAGELTDAEIPLTEALNLGRERNNLHIVAVGCGHLARILRLKGQIPRAKQVCEQGLSDLEAMLGRSPLSGLLLSELGLIEYEWNNLERAQELFLDAVTVAKPWGFWEALTPGYFGLARVRSVVGNVQGAFDALTELETLGENNPSLVMPVVKSSRVLLKVLEGDFDAGLEWAEAAGIGVGDEISYASEGDYLLLARILISAERWSEAEGLIDRLLPGVESGERYGRLIELFILKALSLEGQGDEEAAFDSLSRALELGEDKGYVRIFLDEGTAMQALLGRALSRGISREYVRGLVKAFEVGDAGYLSTARSTPIPPLIEPLSDREVEVLRLLRTELSGPEIAQELSIALSTMRTHTQSIYSKLGVANRRSAVRKAEEFNLL
jgi:LuxR family maltose regulon positive regulatory protein